MNDSAKPKSANQIRWWHLRNDHDLLEIPPAEHRQLLQQETPLINQNFVLVWVERRAGTASAQDSSIEAWVLKSATPGQPGIRGGLRTISVIWTTSRAVVFAPTEHLADAQDAILRFTMLERQIRGLEHDVTEFWPQLINHIPLLHAVSPSDLKKQNEVNHATEKIHHMALAQIRAETELQQLSGNLTATSKRLYAELCHQTLLEKRLDVISIPIDNAVDHYETVNYRMVDERHAHTGKWIEILIVVVLLAELVLNLGDHLGLFASAK